MTKQAKWTRLVSGRLPGGEGFSTRALSAWLPGHWLFPLAAAASGAVLYPYIRRAVMQGQPFLVLAHGSPWVWLGPPAARLPA